MSKEAHTGKKDKLSYFKFVNFYVYILWANHVIKSIFRYNKTIYFLFEIPYTQS